MINNLDDIYMLNKFSDSLIIGRLRCSIKERFYHLFICIFFVCIYILDKSITFHMNYSQVLKLIYTSASHTTPRFLIMFSKRKTILFSFLNYHLYSYVNWKLCKYNNSSQFYHKYKDVLVFIFFFLFVLVYYNLMFLCV